MMNDTDMTQALRAHVADGPPMRITSDGVIAAGRRSRHRRWLASAGGAAGLAAVVVVTAMAFTARTGPSGHTVGGPPPLTTCASLQPSPVPAPTQSAVPARATMDPGAESAAPRVSCYLLSAVPALMPGFTFTPNPARRGTSALVAVPGGMGGGDLEVTATSLATDASGTGLLIVSVSRATESPADEDHCTGPHAKAQCRTGPNGERIEIYDFGAEPDGTHNITVYVYSGQTFILAGASNAGETQNAPRTRPSPPLSVDELITLATAPELKLYP
jgi:hypothetical protein